MLFTPISINDYVKKYLENNPNESEKDLKSRLNKALSDYKKGVKCECGNDIWVVGSASLGNKCFTCITGESNPNKDFEIESALIKRSISDKKKHIDDYLPTEIRGIFDDDGYEINMDLVPKPDLCASCKNNDNPNETVFCNLTRNDQKNSQEFICFAYSEFNTNH